MAWPRTTAGAAQCQNAVICSRHERARTAGRANRGTGGAPRRRHASTPRRPARVRPAWWVVHARRPVVRTLARLARRLGSGHRARARPGRHKARRVPGDRRCASARRGVVFQGAGDAARRDAGQRGPRARPCAADDGLSARGAVSQVRARATSWPGSPPWATSSAATSAAGIPTTAWSRSTPCSIPKRPSWSGPCSTTPRRSSLANPTGPRTARPRRRGKEYRCSGQLSRQGRPGRPPRPPRAVPAGRRLAIPRNRSMSGSSRPLPRHPRAVLVRRQYQEKSRSARWTIPRNRSRSRSNSDASRPRPHHSYPAPLNHRHQEISTPSHSTIPESLEVGLIHGLAITATGPRGGAGTYPLDDSAESSCPDLPRRSLLDRMLDEADALRAAEAVPQGELETRSSNSGESLSESEPSCAPTAAPKPGLLHQRLDAARRAFSRADALVSVAQRYLRGDRPERSPIEITLTIPASSLRDRTADPVEVGQMGEAFVSSETARRLGCDAGIVDIVEDEHGAPLSVGRKRRTIAGALKRALRKRDTTCTYPGCANRIFLEGHHIRHWADGGETSLSNALLLCSLCRARHKLHYAGPLVMSGRSSFLTRARDDTRHNQRLLRKRRSSSSGRNRPGREERGAVRLSARSFIARSASRYICVVSMDS